VPDTPLRRAGIDGIVNGHSAGSPSRGRSGRPGRCGGRGRMERWFSVYTSALSGDLPRLGLIASLYVIFTLFEVGLPAQPGHGLRGRVRNIVFAVIFLLGGLAAASAVMLFFPWRPRLRA